MAFNPADVFPGAGTIKVIDIAAIVQSLNATDDVPVTYSFGGGAPTSISVNGREILNSKIAGSVSDKQGVAGYAARLFVEFDPYSPYQSIIDQES